MKIDDRALKDLLTESQDLQTDALRDTKASLADLRDVGRSRRGKPVDVDRVRAFNRGRRDLLRKGGLGIGGLSTMGLLGTGFGTALTAIVARPAMAQEDVDVQILQTAVSLELLAVATYGTALTLPFMSDNAVVKTFAETTMMQHDEHGKAFNAQATALGGEEQTEPNAKYSQVVQDATPTLTDAGKVVELAMALEQVATQTYVNNVGMMEDTKSKEVMASVMGVEAQHLAVLRAVDALIKGDAADLIALPPDLAALPEAAGSVAFPEPFEGTDNASPPEEGAVQ
ncbi:MAG: ferritin-like domain-containing protein [Actinomycetota bacterium]|nr:ferritin-like domain-containing protein [Acidimicrobiia bacterium]MDQ3146059.1 ferritin-like domain-containing protein [Actinomycetota bacterium]